MAIFTYPTISLSLYDYLLSLINPFKVTNTVSGTTTGTLNQKSGVIAITNNLAAGASGTFTLTNSNAFLTPTKSVIQYSLWYTGAGTPVLTSYYTTNGTAVFTIKNDHSADAINAVMYLQFRIIA